jgi:membrane fusion protein (multidrug efflux system)
MTPPQRILAAGCGVLLALGTASCGNSKAAPAPAGPPEVSVATMHKTSVPVTMELPGRTAPVAVAQVRGRVDGIVLARYFKEGADVGARQRLFEIDPAPYRAALDNALATLARAQANLASTTALAERYKLLLAGNGVAQQDYDNAVAAEGQAQADVAAGKAMVQSARINLGYTDVTSPITGRIGPAAVTQGAYVQASAATLLATVQQLDPIYVDLNQSSVQGLQLRRDIASGKLKLNGPRQAKVTLFLEDGSRYALPGSLQFTDVTVDPNTGSVTVRALFPNPQSVLLPGMFVRASIDEGTNDNVMLVPQVGVTHDATGKATAMVVGADGKVAVKAIQATRTSGSAWVVDGGLEEGDQVIVAGLQRVQPGAAVKPVEAAAAAPAPVASN